MCERQHCLNFPFFSCLPEEFQVQRQAGLVLFFLGKQEQLRVTTCLPAKAGLRAVRNASHMQNSVANFEPQDMH
jgi:hypothetical protein